MYVSAAEALCCRVQALLKPSQDAAGRSSGCTCTSAPHPHPDPHEWRTCTLADTPENDTAPALFFYCARYLRPVPGTRYYIYWTGENDKVVSEQATSSPGSVSSPPVVSLPGAVAASAIGRSPYPAGLPASQSYREVTSAALTHAPLGHRTAGGPPPRGLLTTCNEFASLRHGRYAPAGRGVGDPRNRRAGRAREAGGGGGSDYHDSLPSSTNVLPFGENCSAHRSPLFVRFECQHEFPCDLHEASLDCDRDDSLTGAAAPQPRPPLQMKGSVIDSSHGLSRALKEFPHDKFIPWVDERGEETESSGHGGSGNGGDSSIGPQTHLRIFGTTFPTKSSSRVPPGGDARASGGIRAESRRDAAVSDNGVVGVLGASTVGQTPPSGSGGLSSQVIIVRKHWMEMFR